MKALTSAAVIALAATFLAASPKPKKEEKHICRFEEVFGIRLTLSYAARGGSDSEVEAAIVAHKGRVQRAVNLVVVPLRKECNRMAQYVAPKVPFTWTKGRRAFEVEMKTCFEQFTGALNEAHHHGFSVPSAEEEKTEPVQE